MGEKEKETALKNIGLKIAKARTEKGLAQHELSRMLGKYRSYANNVEAGRINISYYSLLEVCETLEISLIDLLKL